MSQFDLDERLSRISTVWTVLRQAHDAPVDVASAAQQLVIERYGKAITRYLTAALRDPDAAAEVGQEFALCLLRGEFRAVTPEKGRFRSYVTTVLFHLIAKYRERQRKAPRTVAADNPALQGLVSSDDSSDEFAACWRDELLARTWNALAQAHGNYFAVLRCRANNPALASDELAMMLTKQLGQPMTAAAFRQTLGRARERFADLLLDEVARSVDPPTAERVEDELLELNLLDYCRPALGRKNQSR